MENWLSRFTYNPLPPLLTARHPALTYFTQRDLREEPVEAVETLWGLPEAERLVKQQQADGSWKYPGGDKKKDHFNEDYDQIETFRNLGILVEKYGFYRQHEAIDRAAKFLFSRQTPEGDFRGIYGGQYSPNYSAAIMELLIKAGYADDPRIEHGFRWLLALRQYDGGWAIPMRTVHAKFEPEVLLADLIPPNRAKPSSHWVTGVVLRAFAAHPVYCKVPEAHGAGELLAGRFFTRDKYSDRQGVNFWTAFSFPFWFTDLLSALDTLARLGFSPEYAPIKNALAWFVTQQQPGGKWNCDLLRAGGDKEGDNWIGLSICRMFKRFYG